MTSDRLFNYGNRRALELWELSWEEFTCMPSHKSAEPVTQEERDWNIIDRQNQRCGQAAVYSKWKFIA